jgi:glycosyltransferase involved in cell wall biosynthesis
MDTNSMSSFIIQTRNELALLQAAYENLRRVHPDAYIVILDDDSSDGTKEWIFGIKCTRNDSKLLAFFNDGRKLDSDELYSTGLYMIEYSRR